MIRKLVCFLVIAAVATSASAEESNYDKLVRLLHPVNQLESVYLMAISDLQDVLADEIELTSGIVSELGVDINTQQFYTHMAQAYRTVFTPSEVDKLLEFFMSDIGYRFRLSSMQLGAAISEVISDLRTQLFIEMAVRLNKMIEDEVDIPIDVDE